MPVLPPNRRQFLQGLTAAGLAAFTTTGVFAQQPGRNRTTTEGPFYPDKLPLDTDNDLLIINDAITPAVGEITHLTGRVLTKSGQPMRNAFVEIWQVDNKGSYLHTGGRQPTGYDTNFQGYGRFLTGSNGEYYFRTIKPVDYTLQGIFRTPHIHVAVSQNGRRVFTTQTAGERSSRQCPRRLVEELDAGGAERHLLVDFKPIRDRSSASSRANFDIVLGSTVNELEPGAPRGTAPPINRRPGY